MIAKQLPTQSDKVHPCNSKPLGLVFWQGRCWSEATTLPQYAANANPLGSVIQNIRISAYNQAIIVRFGRLVGNAYLCTRKGEERSCLIIHHINLYHND